MYGSLSSRVSNEQPILDANNIHHLADLGEQTSRTLWDFSSEFVCEKITNELRKIKTEKRPINWHSCIVPL